MDQLEQLEACRICVSCFPLKDMDFINIFQPNEGFQQELNFIQGEIRQWQLNIKANDGLPQRICANCFAKFRSIEAFRKECEAAQKKLIESLMPQMATNDPEVQHVIKNTELPLPLVGNYEGGNVSLDSGSNVLVSSVNLSQNDVSLISPDYTAYDQQFLHYDNPALMDASSTLLDGNLIAPETAQELDFLPSQNLFTFETAEPPTTGSLPLGETETTSIINDILEQKPEAIKKEEDLEDMLQQSIIATTSKMTQELSLPIVRDQDPNVVVPVDIKLEPAIKQEKINHAMKVKSEYKNTTITFFNHEDINSDIECDESDMNARLKGLSHACHYCFCPESGAIDHLVFPNEDSLTQHFFDVHDPNRPYTCPKCPQSSKTKLLRDNHVKLMHKIVEIQTCNYCQKRLRGSPEVHQYNCQYIADWQCEQCKETFPQTPVYRFRLHQRQHEQHTTGKHFKCHLCGRSFLKKANLEAHQRIHKTEEQTAHTCDTCNASFLDDYELKRHKYQQHNAEAPLKCKFCNKGFSSNVFLQRHTKQFHSDNVNNNSNGNNASPSITSSSSPPSSASSSSEQPHVCLNCNMGFKTLQKLQQHLLLGRDSNGNCFYSSINKVERRRIQRQGVFPCFHCPRRFHLRSQLDKHLNTHDARLRPFQCEQCVMRCRTTFELKQHVNVAHLNIKAFSCDTCGKCFGYKKDLRDHMLFHAEINVRCTEEGCDYVCKNEKALNDHIRHKHRLLSCEYCREQFTRQKLTAHLRKIHRAEIDVDMAGESDNLYKSQLLNNNNDITQISLNLLNTEQEEQELTSTPIQLTPTSVPSKSLMVSYPTPSSSSILTTSSINSIATSSSSILSSSPPSPALSISSCIISNTKGTNLISNSNCISTQNMINDQDQDHHNHNQLCAIFANDSNSTSLTLNGLVSNEHDLNLVANDTANMFLVPSTSSSTNDNHFDQYFMASLIDTEQEIIVT